MNLNIVEKLYHTRFYPHIYFFANPFKTMELRMLLEGLPFGREKVALDLGSGLGLQTNIIGKHVGRILGIDPQKNAVDRALSEHHLVKGRINSDFRCTTIQDAGLEDNSFDFVFSICVLEHIPDDLDTLKECYRVLKPGGWLAFSIDSLATVTDVKAKTYHKERYEIYRYYTAESAKKLFEEAGFVNVDIQSAVNSDYAARLFEKGVVRDFDYRYSESWILYQRLRLAEIFTRRRDKGIYLMVRARK